MLAWMLYVVMVTLLLSVGAYLAERAARLRRGGTRWIWMAAIIASLAIPTVIASVTVQLPNVLSPAAAEKVVVLREATTQALSPVLWISGSAAEPAGWRDFDSLLTLLWRSVSVAMLLALAASGAYLLARKRRWRTATVSGAQVYVTEGVGPAVVGLLRPRIVVPRWVTMALPAHQSAVIAHEQSHLDARDPQLFTFALALLVFMPWNLPLWWQLRRLRCAIEVDCDARVLKGGIDPTHYGETLISVGERQSSYIGAVAAMSESKSFLEERIRIMISKPVKWRRLGIAGLAGLSVALTALAAQVSPPNTAPAPAEAAPAAANAWKPIGERVAIKLPTATLDRYVGTYKLNDSTFIDVKREGEALKARVTGQPVFEIYPERENFFFWKITDAQLEFPAEAGTAQSATLHQFGKDLPLTRVDAGEAAQAQVALDARMASQTPQPGGEAAVRRLIAGMTSGHPNYDEMSQMLADVAKQQQTQSFELMKQMGPLQSLTFKKVSQGGADVYEGRHANGTLTYIITMAPDGKIGMFGVMGTP